MCGLVPSQKSGDITIATACGDIVVVVSEAFTPSFCDGFVRGSFAIQRHSRHEAESDNIRVEPLLVELTRCVCLCELRGAVPLHEVPYYMFISEAHSHCSPTVPQHIEGVCASGPRGFW